MQVRALMQAAVHAQAGRRQPDRRDHDPADRERARARRCSSSGRARKPSGARARRRSSSHYLVGTMIETPRAALVADRDRRRRRVLLVRYQRPHADDVRLQPRRHRGPLHERVPRAQAARRANPFETLDVEGVGQLVRMGCEQGPRDARRAQARHLRRARRRSRSRSRSATRSASTTCRARRYRVPIARLAAAHAALGSGGPAHDLT